MIEMPAVRCDVPGCENDATHKVAAGWNDARFQELKTYGFACSEHVADIYHKAEVRWLEYEPVPGETVGKIGIFRYEKGLGDSRLVHDTTLEESLLT